MSVKNCIYASKIIFLKATLGDTFGISKSEDTLRNGYIYDV
jgi:hypothetical protein